MLEYLQTWYGPTRAAFEALDGAGREALAADLLAVYCKHNRSGDETLIAPSRYVEVIAVKGPPGRWGTMKRRAEVALAGVVV